MEQVRDCEEADLGVPSHGDEGEVGTDRGKRKKPARLGFKLRRVLNIARKGDPCTPVQPWKVEEDAEDLGTSPARNGSHTAAGDNQKPTCSKQHLRHRFPSVPRSSSSRTLVPNFWEAKDILLQHSGMSREGATSRSLEEEKLAKPFLSRLPAAAPSSSSDLKGRPGYGFKPSTDLLRAFDRIWALEEHHASSLSLACVQELLQENQSEGEAVLSVRDQLHEERRRRRRSESLRRKLAREFSDLKSVYLRSLRDLESEKKAHEGAEFCDELAEGIREYEELRELRRSDGGAAGHGRRRRHLVLQVSEAWLDARRQAKLARVRGGDLAGEVEGFLQAIRLHPAAKTVSRAAPPPPIAGAPSSPSPSTTPSVLPGTTKTTTTTSSPATCGGGATASTSPAPPGARSESKKGEGPTRRGELCDPRRKIAAGGNLSPPATTRVRRRPYPPA
ncbi:unnamed protein product [Spirodela intermedia]|uniref:Uncharacterized protein n=1 Tax=Spirodela intermedia TaxID=51605 RepID=A0A7I8ITT2_SPIIN|nr:unnamed protein product [Spirodela intermedia]CAA6661028.1 unnamed protein product [Spirodela intermedia]